MLNQVVFVGRLTEDPTIEKVEGNVIGTITLAVQRTFRNEKGICETDFIPCKLWNTVAISTSEYCKKGDIVGVKGRIQTIKMASGSAIEVVAEKLTFLSSKREEEKEDEGSTIACTED